MNNQRKKSNKRKLKLRYCKGAIRENRWKGEYKNISYRKKGIFLYCTKENGEKYILLESTGVLVSVDNEEARRKYLI